MCDSGLEAVTVPSYPCPTPGATRDSPIDPAHERALVAAASLAVSAMLIDCIQITPKQAHLFVLYDLDTPLTRILSTAYKQFIDAHCSPETSTFVLYNTETPAELLERMSTLQANDCVVLIQTNQFRLNDYRIRIELFKRHIKTIEHVHAQIIPVNEYPQYIDALAFSPKKSGPLAHSLKARLDVCERVEVDSVCGSRLVYEGGMQKAKLNIGDYTGMNGVGGTFPLGEVFTEAMNLKGVNGKLAIFGHPSLQKTFTLLEKPIILEFVEGQLRFEPENGILPENCTEEFSKLLSVIRAGEGSIVLREFGLGLNEGMDRQRSVRDIFAFERQYGMHVSLGKKHNIFKIPSISANKATFHIDIFVDVETIRVDGEPMFINGRYTQ